MMALTAHLHTVAAATATTTATATATAIRVCCILTCHCRVVAMTGKLAAERDGRQLGQRHTAACQWLIRLRGLTGRQRGFLQGVHAAPLQVLLRFQLLLLLLHACWSTVNAPACLRGCTGHVPTRRSVRDITRGRSWRARRQTCCREEWRGVVARVHALALACLAVGRLWGWRCRWPERLQRDALHLIEGMGGGEG